MKNSIKIMLISIISVLSIPVMQAEEAKINRIVNTTNYEIEVIHSPSGSSTIVGSNRSEAARRRHASLKKINGQWETLIFSGKGIIGGTMTLTPEAGDFDIYVYPHQLTLEKAHITPVSTKDPWDQFKAAKAAKQAGRPYEHLIFGVSAVPTKKELTSAWKKTIAKWHPDRHRGNEAYANEVAQIINEAHTELDKYAK
jgi:hypothetical protein